MCGDTLSSNPIKRLAYNIAVAIFAYIAPLIVIFYSYFRILYVLQKRCDRRTVRVTKCNDNNTRNCHISQLNASIKSGTSKYINSNKTKRQAKKLARTSLTPELNTHNMKTITRAKLKTLKLTVIIGKKNVLV